MFDPVEMGVDLSTQDQVRVWRERLRYHLLSTRSRCDRCGRLLTSVEVHEGIVTRQDVRGWKLPRKALIFTEVNSFVLCPKCHRPSPPSREWCWESACERYGGDIVLDWYENLPFKSRPRRFVVE